MKRITHTSSSRLDNGSVYIETDSRLPIASLISLCAMQDSSLQLTVGYYITYLIPGMETTG